MYKSKNPYKLKVLLDTAGQERYYVSFKDGTGTIQEVEISRELFLEFQSFEKEYKHEANIYDRYIEHVELTEEQLSKRALNPPKSLEEEVNRRIIRYIINKIILDLPQAHTRRFILYYEFGFTLEKIAELEGCSKMAVKKSIDSALRKILKYI